MATTDKTMTGGVPATTTAQTMTPSSPGAGQTLDCTDLTSWPSGASSHSFVVRVNKGLVDEEAILVSSRSSNQLTIETRGYDGTTAQNHALGAAIIHSLDAASIQAHETHVARAVRSGVLTSRGTASSYTNGTYWATDVLTWYRSDGTNWYPTGAAGGTYTTTQRDALAAAEVFAGRVIYNSTTARMEVYSGASWMPLSNLSLKGFSEAAVATQTGVTGALTLDLANGNNHDVTFGAGNITSLVLSNIPASRVISLTLWLTQDGTGSRTMVWTSVKWAGGTAPTLSTGASKRDVFTLVSRDGGTTWEGFTAGLDMR